MSSALLFVVFTGAKYRNSPTLYLCFMAALDGTICAIYGPFFAVDALALYLQIDWLWHLWHVYVMVLYSISRVGEGIFFILARRYA